MFGNTNKIGDCVDVVREVSRGLEGWASPAMVEDMDSSREDTGNRAQSQVV